MQDVSHSLHWQNTSNHVGIRLKHCCLWSEHVLAYQIPNKTLLIIYVDLVSRTIICSGDHREQCDCKLACTTSDVLRTCSVPSTKLKLL